VHEWLEQAVARLAAAAGDEPDTYGLSEDEQQALLDLARIAAHESGDRTNAPLLCYLVGRAEGAVDLQTLADAVRSTS
jgi:hypothetical protein